MEEITNGNNEWKSKYLKYKMKYLKLRGAQVAGEKISTYYIHDNGGRPFKVDIIDNIVKIYTQIDCDKEQDKIIYASDPILTFKPSKIFIGKDPEGLTNHEPGCDCVTDGNTILLKMEGNEYILVGATIDSYDSLGEIVKFVSRIGNNDVPYPYAVDEYGNIYLFSSSVILKNSDEMQSRMKDYDDPYDYYYDYYLITRDEGIIPTKYPKIKYFNNINDYYIGKDQYTLTYEPFPSDDYDRLMKPPFKGPMYVVDVHGSLKIYVNVCIYIYFNEAPIAAQ